MRLTNAQYLGQSQSKNSLHDNDYTLSGAYWNKIWNSKIFKYMIPYSPHPSNETQVSMISRKTIDSMTQNLALSDLQAQIDLVHRHLEEKVGTIKFVDEIYPKKTFIKL